MDAVVFKREVEQPVREFGDERPLVDQEPLEHRVTLGLDRAAFPKKFSRVGHDAAADDEMCDVGIDDSCRKEIELEAAGGVTAVGAAVDLQDGRRRCLAGLAKLRDDLGNEPALAFVSEADANIGDEAAVERCQCHEGKGS
jgi:hypothetical protein